jgi:hypothetical protein
MPPNNERPLTREEAHSARLAMAARKEVDDVVARLGADMTLRRFCIEQAVECLKRHPIIGYVGVEENDDPSRLARRFHEFLTEVKTDGD